MLDLWDMAQSANFTKKELEAFRVGTASQPWGLAASLPVDFLITWGRSSSLVPADQRFHGNILSPCPLCPSPALVGNPCGTKLASGEQCGFRASAQFWVHWA